jgi:hypothetical protein
MSTQPIEVFYSYAREDEALRDALEKHLSILHRQGLISSWHDRKIVPSTDWEQTLDAHLESASLILLLISSDFLASDYCYGVEMKRALERHHANEARVIPILLRPIEWKGAPFARLQALPTDAKPVTSWSNQDEAFANIASGIRRTIKDMSSRQTKAPHSMPSSISAPGEASPQIKALFLAANPKSTSRSAIDEEMHAIEQKFRAAQHRDALIFQSSWAVRPDDLLQLLNQHRPHVVHFSGQGSAQGLSLVGNDGQERLVTTRALQYLFTALKDNIRLVLLNACYSREQAQALVGIIDCVIGMKSSISAEAATTFASSFYRAIGFGRSVQAAFDQGIASLLLEGIAEEAIPELLVKDGIDPRQIVLIGPPTNP